MSTADEQPLINISLADVDDQDVNMVATSLHASGIADTVASAVLGVLPDPTYWRLTVSGDLAATVNRLDGLPDSERYTLGRGAGRVGARTKQAADGVFDIVIDLDSFFINEIEDPEAVARHARAAAAHLGTHEAGHALLALRSEDSARYDDRASGGMSERAWRHNLASHLDDFRIERMTRRVAPAPISQVLGLPDAIAHVRDELTASRSLISADIGEACQRSIQALDSLVRVIAYTTAELGLTEGGHGARPHPRPDGWNRYLDASWDTWAEVFHAAKPADEAMTLDELAGVLSMLCRLTLGWSDSVGFKWRMDGDRRQTAYWTANTY